MADQTGHITVNERVPNERFNKFVEEQVRGWVREHAISEDATDYEVAFFDEDQLGEVSCLVVIHNGEHLWRSWQSADNPRIALRRTLERLHEDFERLENESPYLTH